MMFEFTSCVSMGIIIIITELFNEMCCSEIVFVGNMSMSTDTFKHF